MKKYFIFPLTIILLFNCTQDPFNFRRGKNIPKDDFVSIIAEIHLMDAITDHHRLYNEFSSADTLHLYKYILDKYGYTQAEFDTTVVNYSRRPDKYERVYNEVLMKLNYMLDTLQQIDPVFEKDEIESKRSRGSEGKK